MKLLKSLRLTTSISLAFILAIGLLYSKYRYSIPWLNQEMGGIFYQIFWCLFFFIFFPSKSAVIKVPIWVLIVTCSLEFLQLWHPPFLNWIRSFAWGKMLIGTTFNWADFPYYFLGSGLGWLWLKFLTKEVAK